MTDSITAVLDWEPASGDIVPLEDDAIDEVTDDTVRLRGAFFGGKRRTGRRIEPEPWRTRG